MPPIQDFNALVFGSAGYAKPQSLTDATYINGAEIDRCPQGGQKYDAALVIATLAYTAASGASGATVTTTLALFDDTATGMGTEAVFDSDTFAYTWAADGANGGVHYLPVNLEQANRYIRAKFKITKAGTITVSSAIGSIAVVLMGQKQLPNASYSSVGYETTNQAS